MNVELREARLDAQAPRDRDEMLLRLIRKQTRHCAEHVPFWRHRLEQASIDPAGIRSFLDWRRIPVLRKTELRHMDPWTLVPAQARANVCLARSTSGSTGTPTTTMWTHDDWRALSWSVSRMLVPPAGLSPLRAFNGYHQGHLTGPLYDAAIRALGGTRMPRSHVDEDTWSTLDQIRIARCNTLVLAEQSHGAKTGVAMADLIERSTAAFGTCGIEWWIGSSGTFDPTIVGRAKALGVREVTNL